MKKLFFAAIMSVIYISCFAQGPDWGDRMKSEKIGFITSAVGLTSEEAQTFWPVYNKIQDLHREATDNMFMALRKLQIALKEKKSEKEISNLLNDYIKAQSEANLIDSKYVKEYEKAIPPEKVARLFIAEEEFRKMQIRKLSFREQFDNGPSLPQSSGKPMPDME